HATRLSSAWRNTSSTCSRVTPGNHSRNSSMLAPPSRFSNSALTGTRLCLNSHSPPPLVGMRSTAGHLLQSNMLGILGLGAIFRKLGAFRLISMGLSRSRHDAPDSHPRHR